MSLWEYANPRRFLGLSERLLPGLSALALLLLTGGLIWGFFYSPDDYRMGSTVKIIYLHVPSALMAINGWINFEIAAAIVLGENIGTTVTAWLASLGANINAKRAARAHFIFNIAGVCWMLLLFYPFIGMLDEIMPGAIYTEDVTQVEAVAYLEDNDFTGDPTEDDLFKAKKAIVDRNIPLHLII